SFALRRPTQCARLMFRTMGDHMPATSLRLVVIAALCVSQGAFAAPSKRPRHAPETAPAAAPAAPYKADRLSSSRGETILNTPGQTTVLPRQVLDDKHATSLRDAMRSTAGVTIGRYAPRAEIALKESDSPSRPTP